ncbi:STAS domain-containing protein [Psychromonas ossibalaenae]|uniref:STAS domain-containing protein n=1 Tax=Psychromonas ossibalaenae TaxID=444922 RepID=UPI00037C617C|nr:STAS domain-containing protein [Psychromonas ossibalaenae]
MAIEITNTNDLETLININDEMTIYTVLEQKNCLLTHLQAGHTLNIDLSAVSEIDSAGIQLLIFMKKTADKLDSDFNLLHHSQSVFEVIELFNLTDFFADPIVLPAEWK